MMNGNVAVKEVSDGYEGDDLYHLKPLKKTQVNPVFSELCSELGVNYKQQGAWVDEFGKSLREWAEKNFNNPVKTLSLFSGAGGLDIGF
ncbi:DNA cytosine methyltransferase, partial [Candidatus Enterovibrio escicola]|uniref:DNA cytosine methyltransferase n=1 Tax=Candidatus Enterovibrio escicola TaxID=1927127 RepID=UPI0012380C05